MGHYDLKGIGTADVEKGKLSCKISMSSDAFFAKFANLEGYLTGDLKDLIAKAIDSKKDQKFKKGESELNDYFRNVQKERAKNGVPNQINVKDAAEKEDSKVNPHLTKDFDYFYFLAKAYLERDLLSDAEQTLQKIKKEFKDKVAEINEIELMFNVKVLSKNEEKSLVKKINSPVLISESKREISKEQQKIELRIGSTFTFQKKVYLILDKLGQGGMGAVFLARNQVNGQICAIKVFLTEKYFNANKNTCEEYWDRECRILGIQSQSPVPAIKLIGAFKNDKCNPPQYLLFMDYINGITLEKWMQQTNSDLNTKIARILIPLAKHLAFVHLKGIIHRDITPRNIMIVEDTGNPIPYLIDWGVAKELPLDRMFSPKKPYFTATTTAATTITSVGNPPEVLFGLNPIAASDIYMFGCVCLYLFTNGKIIPPQQLLQPTLDLTEFLPNMPKMLVELVEQMVHFEPADRPGSMQIVGDTLERILISWANLPETNIKSPESSIRTSIQDERNPWECGHCGAVNTAKTKFCVVCGKKNGQIKEEIPPWEATQTLQSLNEQTSPWDCESCGAVNTAKTKFCVVCGKKNERVKDEPPPDQQKFCIYCGKSIPAQALFCQFCGKEVQ